MNSVKEKKVNTQKKKVIENINNKHDEIDKNNKEKGTNEAKESTKAKLSKSRIASKNIR